VTLNRAPGGIGNQLAGPTNVPLARVSHPATRWNSTNDGIFPTDYSKAQRSEESESQIIVQTPSDKSISANSFTNGGSPRPDRWARVNPSRRLRV